MAELFDTAGLSADKRARYADIGTAIAAVVAGERDPVARMASVAAMLYAAFEHYSWAGFYRVDPTRSGELVIGPYQGSLGCLRIPPGRGVCGAAAQTLQTFVVDDVDAFPDHIACDSRSRSEIVVPVLDATGALIAVLDVDAVELSAFDAIDREGLERILAQVFGA